MNKHERTLLVLEDMKKAGYHECVIGSDAHSPACAWWGNSRPRSVWGWHDSWTVGTRDTDKETGRDSKKCRIDGWPAVWRILEKHKVKTGCGNSHQSQLMDGMLIEGVYDLRQENALELINNNWVLEAI